jgi:hypothetical protein
MVGAQPRMRTCSRRQNEMVGESGRSTAAVCLMSIEKFFAVKEVHLLVLQP